MQTAATINGHAASSPTPSGRMSREQGQRAREVMAQLGKDADYETVHNKLAEEGIDLGKQTFWNLRGKLFNGRQDDPTHGRKPKAARKPARKPPVHAPTPKSAPPEDESPLVSINELKAFFANVQRIGGPAIARQLLDVAESKPA